MTFKELLDIFDIKFGDITNRRLPPAYVKKLLNEGQKDIARKTFVLDSTYTTNSVVGQATYGLSNEHAFGGILQVAYDGKELDATTAPILSTTQGTPSKYYLLEGTIGLYPVPAQVKEIKVVSYEIPNDMTTDGSVSPIPHEYHDVILDYALWHAFRSVGERESALEHQEYYRAGIGEITERATDDQQHQLYEVKSMVRQIF